MIVVGRGGGIVPQEFEAGEDGCAFLDILIPPYEPNDGRDCHYYISKQTSKEDIYELTMVGPPPPDVWDVTSARYAGPPPPQPSSPADHS